MSNSTFEHRVSQFLQRYGEVIPINYANWGRSNTKILPFIVERAKQQFAVFAFHWNKSIGTNTIIKTEHNLEDMNGDNNGYYCEGVIIIGNEFSQNAIDMTRDINQSGKTTILLVKKDEMEEILNSC